MKREVRTLISSVSLRSLVFSITAAIFFCLSVFLSSSWGYTRISGRDAVGGIREKDALGQLREAQKGCAGETERSKQILCFKKRLENPLKRAGLASYVQAIEAMFGTDAKDQDSITMCHDLLHVVGGIAGASSSDFALVVSSCTESCTYGCYHGAIEGAIASGHTQTDLIDACVRLSRTAKNACFHGLGHGAASLTGFRLRDALTICDKVPQEWRADCGSGVLMEIYEPSTFVHGRQEFPNDIPAFCATLHEPYSDTCYATAGLHAYGRSQDASEAFATCGRIPRELRDICIFYIGNNAYFVFNGAAEKIDALCAAEDASVSADYQRCREGAIAASSIADPSVKFGFAACASAETQDRQSCVDFLAARLDEHRGKDARIQLCQGPDNPVWLTQACLIRP